MSVTIPAELQQAVEQKAAQRQVSVERVVQEAIEQYLERDEELLDELTAWQEVRDEALKATGGMAP